MQYYSLVDLIFLPIYLVIILMAANIYARKQVTIEPVYKYYTRGLLAKILGGLGLAFVYTIYYPGGDTIQYFLDSLAFQKLIFVDFKSFFEVLTKKADISNFYYFSSETGYPAYCRDPKAWFVVKMSLFLVGFAFQSYLVTTLLCASLSFLGVWKLYQVYVSEFPELNKEMAISFLFIPSVFFWGSGLLKDTFTFCALGFFIWGVYNLLIVGNKRIKSVISIIISGYVIVAIKPYILVGLLPAVVIWVIHRLVDRIRGAILKAALFPLLIVLGVGFAYLFMVVLGEALAEYKLDTILEKAVVNQRDLKSDYHKGNAFDIGEFDASIGSILSKFPIATFSAIYRPLIVESNNVVMFISGIENLIILIFSIRVLILVRFFKLFRLIFKHHLLTFSFFFALLFAYSVGLTTSNFGSLVRYKIPCIPFFVASLYITRYLYLKELDVINANKVQLPDLDAIYAANQRVA
ncbi:MAG: hypothetical protein JNL88_09015 [Bacteroidia bacterium]|nr:hypothetical protein [Bacteroidia bacterium]